MKCFGLVLLVAVAAVAGDNNIQWQLASPEATLFFPTGATGAATLYPLYPLAPGQLPTLQPVIQPAQQPQPQPEPQPQPQPAPQPQPQPKPTNQRPHRVCKGFLSCLLKPIVNTVDNVAGGIIGGGRQ